MNYVNQIYLIALLFQPLLSFFLLKPISSLDMASNHPKIIFFSSLYILFLSMLIHLILNPDELMISQIHALIHLQVYWLHLLILQPFKLNLSNNHSKDFLFYNLLFQVYYQVITFFSLLIMIKLVYQILFFQLFLSISLILKINYEVIINIVLIYLMILIFPYVYEHGDSL